MAEGFAEYPDKTPRLKSDAASDNKCGRVRKQLE
jgi:hypothetical protein